MRRIVSSLCLLAIALAGCGGSTTTTSTGGLDPVTFTVRRADDGRDLTLRVGDEFIVVVPLEEPRWQPLGVDRTVLDANGFFDVLPSDPEQAAATVEWSWTAVQPGETLVTLTRASQRVQYTVTVINR